MKGGLLENFKEECRQEGRMEGIAKGVEKGRMETAKNLLKEKVNLKIIQKATKLPLKEIKKLKG